LFRFDIDLVSTDGQVAFDDIVGQKAVLKCPGPDGDRYVHGIVSRFEQMGHGRTLTYYAARLVPRVWTLMLRQQCRIYQNLSTPDVLTTALKDAGIPTDLFRLALKRSYKPRKYCVQYRETDFNFVSRIMEEEGI